MWCLSTLSISTKFGGDHKIKRWQTNVLGKFIRRWKYSGLMNHFQLIKLSIMKSEGYLADWGMMVVGLHQLLSRDRPGFDMRSVCHGFKARAFSWNNYIRLGAFKLKSVV